MPDVSGAVLNSQDYKACELTGVSADDAKPPLYGNDLSALKVGPKTRRIDTFSSDCSGKWISMRRPGEDLQLLDSNGQLCAQYDTPVALLSFPYRVYTSVCYL